MLNLLSKSYFFSSFFWSTSSKILNAVLGFVSVPLLLGYFGKADYGLLSIATAFNGYMSLMDLGMNVGTVKFYSQWDAQGKKKLINNVARTNITFYLFIAVINIIGLLALALWGEPLFSVSHDQFLELRYCFVILAVFSGINWVTTVYSQLLTAYKKLDYIMKVQCGLTLLRGFLIACVFIFDLSLIQYFFYVLLIVACSLIPYAYKCKQDNLIDSFLPAAFWSDFRVVLSFSLSLFALSLFQVTATQSRPIILSIFASNGAETVADFRIVEVIPQFIITVCGTFLSIFLPRSSEMVIKNSKEDIQEYVNSWTTKTTVLVCILCFPFISGAKSILSAYVGDEYLYLTRWLQLWCVFLIVQMHSTPAFSFVLAKGKTKLLVAWTAIACLLSMVVNIALCNIVPVGSAIVGYVVYMLCLIWVYYILFYKRYLDLKRFPIFMAFVKPFTIGAICMVLPTLVERSHIVPFYDINDRVNHLLHFFVYALLWLVPYAILILSLKQIKLSDLKK